MKELISLGIMVVSFLVSVVTMVKGYALASYIFIVISAIAFSVIFTKALNYGDYYHPEDD